MSLGTLLVLIGLGIFVFVLILFPEARTLLKGFTRIFIQDRASTPEGAKAVYAEKIDQLHNAPQCHFVRDRAVAISADSVGTLISRM